MAAHEAEGGYPPKYPPSVFLWMYLGSEQRLKARLVDPRPLCLKA